MLKNKEKIMKTELEQIIESDEYKKAEEEFENLSPKEQKAIKEKVDGISKWFEERRTFFYPYF